MVIVKECMRFAHSEGHTDVCYSSNGEHLATAGSDGDVRIYHGHDDDDPVSVGVKHPVNSIAVKNNFLVAVGESNSVWMYSFPTGTPDGIVTRFTAQVSHVTFNQHGDKVAAGAEDFEIKVVSVNNYNNHTLTGHEAPILTVAFDPTDSYLVSSSCDGTVKIWDMKTYDCSHSLSILPKCNDISATKSFCRLAWQPKSGELLAIPIDCAIELYKRSSWKKIGNLSENGHENIISTLVWSPNGKYLASAGDDGVIIIWNVSREEVIDKVTHDKNLKITGLSWHPSANEIAYTDIEGQLGICSNIIPEDLLKKSSEKRKIHQTLKKDADDDVNNGIDLKDIDSLDDEMVLDQQKRCKRSNFVIDSAEEEDDNISMRKVTHNLFFEVATVRRQPKPVAITLQREFQPGSTPKYLNHRIMMWNSVGVVHHHTEDDLSSIDVEFHDVTTHHALHIANHLNHSLAALSSQALLLASEGNDSMASTLVCLHFSTWDNSKEWSTTMPEKEIIKAIAAGKTWVAAATDNFNVRIYSISGIQLGIFTLAGPVVAMSGHDDIIMVVYHAGVPFDNNQRFNVKIIDAKKGRSIYKYLEPALPITPGSKLSWLGFSDEGVPVTYDTAGIVRVLQKSYGYSWIPVLNARQLSKNKSDTYWAIGLNGNSRQLRCILCKASAYPSTVPRPVATVLPLQIPLCEINTDKSSLEERYLWNNNAKFMKLHDGNNVKEQNATIMKLFALACKSDREFRAAELCELLSDEHTISLAIKYAARNRRMALSQKLEDIYQRRMELGDNLEIEEDEEEEEEGGGNFLEPPRRKFFSDLSALSREYASPLTKRNEELQTDNGSGIVSHKKNSRTTENELVIISKIFLVHFRNISDITFL
ncbi:uncharacterized protein TRIADDRAFT_32433 [Trichoplax adhaerens]|uniref:Uncharacterized protein n=1 Tax=Trichoplax adhaerens TaxID=10228 RepID=B3SAW3_TRIAD|nr:hypothetical protein TRIADDRAFT_32433 [Trichoplax adhaerens]EDV20225.1 hypothetical protein TRIADDRAFT_32433 [Trichoplax adhaerens]|eukprot:XP_002117386.1 hypothetical protein TRIADDRAFT_32433 [Trichoplax adhaerens]